MCGTVYAQHHGMAGDDLSARHGAAFARFASEMDAGMAKMMRDMHAPGYSGHADKDFLAMMIPHHAGAVDMARLVLQHGRDPLTRQLAEEIIAGQTVEIESMQRRLHTLQQRTQKVRKRNFRRWVGRGGLDRQP